MTAKLSLAKRLEALTKKSDGCWEFTGTKNKRGYGKFKVGRSSRQAHRVAYALAHGPIPEGKIVCHRCDNPSCIRPDHLFLGTHEENMADMVAKGRWKRPARFGVGVPNCRVTDDVVRAIRVRYQSETAAALAAEFGIHPMYVFRIAHRLERAHVPDSVEHEAAHG